MTALARHLAPLARRVRGLIARAVVDASDDAKRAQTLRVRTGADEPLDATEHMQPYGFTSRAKAGAEALVLALGGSRSRAVVLAVADRRYRLVGLQEGEVAIYDDQGQSVRLGRAGMTLTAPLGLTIIGNVTIQGNLSMSGVGGVPGTMQIAANVALTGNLTQTGNLTSSGQVAGATLAMGGQVLTTAPVGNYVRLPSA